MKNACNMSSMIELIIQHSSFISNFSFVFQSKNVAFFNNVEKILFFRGFITICGIAAHQKKLKFFWKSKSTFAHRMVQISKFSNFNLCINRCGRVELLFKKSSSKFYGALSIPQILIHSISERHIVNILKVSSSASFL